MLKVKSYVKEDKVFIMEDLSRMTVKEYRLAIKEYHKYDSITAAFVMFMFLSSICFLIYTIVGICMGW